MKNANGVARGWIEKMIADFLAASPSNTMQDETGEPAWEDALVGFASGADPIWQQYKEYVGPFHWTPWEHVKQTYHFEGYGCGLCQVGVPCEAGIPVKSAREALEHGELPPAPPPLA